jgi:hypothetical protein
MTVGKLIQMLKVYPEQYEILIELKGTEDIFTTFDLVFSGEFKPFREEQFDGTIGEIVNSHNRNCVGLMRKKEVRK